MTGLDLFTAISNHFNFFTKPSGLLIQERVLAVSYDLQMGNVYFTVVNKTACVLYLGLSVANVQYYWQDKILPDEEMTRSVGRIWFEIDVELWGCRGGILNPNCQPRVFTDAYGGNWTTVGDRAIQGIHQNILDRSYRTFTRLEQTLAWGKMTVSPGWYAGHNRRIEIHGGPTEEECQNRIFFYMDKGQIYERRLQVFEDKQGLADFSFVNVK